MIEDGVVDFDDAPWPFISTDAKGGCDRRRAGGREGGRVDGRVDEWVAFAMLTLSSSRNEWPKSAPLPARRRRAATVDARPGASHHRRPAAAAPLAAREWGV